MDALERLEYSLGLIDADLWAWADDARSVCRELRERRKFCEVYKDNRHLDVVMNDAWMRMNKELEEARTNPLTPAS